MAIDDNTSYELTGYQVKDLAQKIRAKADSSSLASVATSGLYSDLTGAPTIPTVYNGTLTLVQNGTTVGTFTANQNTNTTVNLAGGVYADDPTTPANPDAWITPSEVDWSTFGNQSTYIDLGSIRIAFGSATLDSIASGAETPKQVNFGVSFDSAPTVTYTVASWIPVVFQVVSSIQTSYFDALVKHNFGSTLNVPIRWIAIGAKPTS